MEHGKARGPRDCDLLVRSSVLYLSVLSILSIYLGKYLKINNSISRPFSGK
jgi:hypothetical protein